VAEVAARGVLLLDSGAISAMATGDPVARAVVARARREGRRVAIPAAVLAEVVTGRASDAPIDRVIKAVDETIELSATRARQAGVLRDKAHHTRARDRDERPPSVVDATLVAEAVAAGAAVILTSDLEDMERLRDAAGVTSSQVVIVRV
jgi:predicted nucleic acid-binding protein